MDGKQAEKDGDEGKVGGGEGGGGSGGEEGGAEGKVGGGSSTSLPVLLPEVQRVTGEEGEKKIVQVFIGNAIHLRSQLSHTDYMSDLDRTKATPSAF